jgi:hypothetical protein
MTSSTGSLLSKIGGEGVGDEPDAAADFAPVVVAEDAVADAQGAAGGAVVAGDEIDEGGLAAAVRAEDAPVLAGIDPPGDAFENRTAAAEGEVGDFENGDGHETECGMTNAECRTGRRQENRPFDGR